MKIPARVKVLIPVLLTAMAVESALGLFGLVVGKQVHPSSDRPATRLVDTRLVHPVATPVVASLLSPGVAPSSERKRLATATAVVHTTGSPAPTSSTTTAPTTIVARRVRVESLPLYSGGAAPAVQPGWGCADALAWLSTHSAPGYQFVCPGYAEGHQAMTCDNTAACPGTKLIAIAVPCPAAYMNEAHNSWIVAGLTTGVIDPFGHCS